MSLNIRLLAFAGSARKDSLNKKLVRIAAEGAREAGAEVTLIDLNDFPMPIYDLDLQAKLGMDPQAEKLQALFKQADGLLIASPEHNSTVSALLKNVIDWLTRSGTNDSDLEAFKEKTAVIMSASPGMLGGLRGLAQLRSILSSLGVLVLPEQKAVGQAMNQFNEVGGMTDAEIEKSIKKLGSRLASVTDKLKN